MHNRPALPPDPPYIHPPPTAPAPAPKTRLFSFEISVLQTRQFLARIRQSRAKSGADLKTRGVVRSPGRSAPCLAWLAGWD
eukprot:1529987-Rhodomonas_salina.1